MDGERYEVRYRACQNVALIEPRKSFAILGTVSYPRKEDLRLAGSTHRCARLISFLK